MLGIEIYTKPIDELPNVGDKIIRQLNKLQIFSIWNLLLHLPRDYENQSQITPISDLIADQKRLTEGEVFSVNLVGRRKKILIAKIRWDNYFLDVKFFHYSHARLHQLQVKTRVRCFGMVKNNKGNLEMIHPDLTVIKANDSLPNYLISTYPSVEGLPQYRLRKMIAYSCQTYLKEAKNDDFQRGLLDFLQQPLQQSATPNSSKSVAEYIRDLVKKPIDLYTAIYQLHFPSLDSSIEMLLEGRSRAHIRLILEELCVHHLISAKIRGLHRQAIAIPLAPPAHSSKKNTTASLSLIPKAVNENIVQQYLATLPFQLTLSQEKTIAEIEVDLEPPKPMMRLLQGDVGSGKTVVAVVAMLLILKRGWQAALMAPTELLAIQHFENISASLIELGIEIHLLLSKTKAKERKQILDRLLSGEPLIVIGTHALFQNTVEFINLGLLIIDEQHRFGVNQRLQLLKKSEHSDYRAHQLFLSATPIPRTLAMTVYSELSQSILDEKPAGRTEIKTLVVENSKIEQIYKSVRNQCEQGNQVYWVCPFIEDSELLDVQSVASRYEDLQQNFPQLHIGLLHGKLNEVKKQQVMQAFKDKELGLLLATTIIEVGIDVPNASYIVIEHAERMGLAQLHQLRGRVGRGNVQSQCLLVYQAPLSDESKQRLQAMRDSNDGFHLAELDLRIRGAGDFSGIKQSGNINFKVANFYRDFSFFPITKEISKFLLTQKSLEELSCLLDKWRSNAEEYAKV